MIEKKPACGPEPASRLFFEFHPPPNAAYGLMAVIMTCRSDRGHRQAEERGTEGVGMETMKRHKE
jgi:hypothetical protein